MAIDDGQSSQQCYYKTQIAVLRQLRHNHTLSDRNTTLQYRYLLMNTELIGNDVCNGLCISCRSRATAIDLVSDFCKLVGHTVCNVRPENTRQHI